MKRPKFDSKPQIETMSVGGYVIAEIRRQVAWVSIYAGRDRSQGDPLTGYCSSVWTVSAWERSRSHDGARFVDAREGAVDDLGADAAGEGFGLDAREELGK